MDVKKALELRAERKKHKPHFVRQNAGKKLEVGTKYRKPREYQSKMRRRKAGYLPMPTQGYRAPQLVRGTDATGKMPVVVHAVKDLDALTASQSAIIGSTVGAKKRIMILEAMQEKKVATQHDVVKELDALKAVFRKKAEAKKKIEEKKVAEVKDAEPAKTQKVEKPKATEKKSETSDEKTEETQDEKKRREQEKILTDKKTAM
jgi:ribosomal protein L32E